MSFTLLTRRAYFSPPSLSPSHSVAIHTRTISSAIAEPMILPPVHRTLVSECERASHDQDRDRPMELR